MATKKKQSEEVLEKDLFQDGDYFSAEIKTPGKQKNIKIRGIIEQLWGYGNVRYLLANNQNGEELDCNHEFSFGVHVSGANEEGLAAANLTNFTVITDKRLIKVIENDKLPEIANYRAKQDSYGEVSFGCGAVTVSKDEIKTFLAGMERLKGMKDIRQFFEVCDTIMREESVDTLVDIDTKEVTKLLERLN